MVIYVFHLKKTMSFERKNFSEMKYLDRKLKKALTQNFKV